jgi:transposase-like protein
MVTIILHCPHCQSEALVRDCHAPNDKQKFRCHACGRRSRENPIPNASSEARREEILHAYQERSSLRGLTRTFGVSRATVSTWLKKKVAQLPPLHTTLLAPIPKMPLPRRWNPTYCGHLCSKKPTTPGCGWPYVARRDRWSPMPSVIGVKKRVSGCGKPFCDTHRTGHCFMDFWAAYAAVIPSEQHTSVGKETGATAHVERWNNTALPASGSFYPHDALLFQIGGHARGLPPPLSASLQSRPDYPSQMSHYQALI